MTQDRRARKLAAAYGFASILLLAGAVVGAWFSAPSCLALLWPALALAIVATAYLTRSTKPFEKSADGSIPLASRLLLWPYRLGATFNAWAWTRRLPAQVRIADGVFLGRYPTAAEADAFGTVIDLAAEFARPAGTTARWISIPTLDLLPPTGATVSLAVEAIEAASRRGPFSYAVRSASSAAQASSQRG